MNTNHIRSAGQWLIYGLVFAPLVFLPQYFVFPYIVPKVIAMRVLILLILGVALVLFVTEKRYQVWRSWISPIGGALVAFLAVLGLTAATGYDWYRSIWDNHERMMGVFTIAHFIALFFAARIIVTTADAWRRLWQGWLVAAVFVIGIGIIQKFEPNFLLNRGNGRVLSTLGNPIYVSAYGLFTFFISLRYALQDQAMMRWGWAAGALLGIAGIIVGGGRGAMVALLAALGVIVILLARLAPEARMKRSARTACIVGVVLVGVFLALRQVPAIQSVPVIGRLATISPTDVTARTRLMAWQVAWESWQDYPLLGWGPGNFSYAFSKHYNPDFLQFGTNETWFDNAHNVFLNTLTTSGILGAMAYVGLFGSVAFVLVRAYRKQTIAFIPLVLGIGYLTAHIVHNLFVFESATSYLALMLWLAWVDSESKPLEAVGGKLGLRPAPWLITVTVVAVVLAIGVTNASVGAVAHLDYRMRLEMSQGNIEEAIATREAAQAWRSPHYYDLMWDFASGSIDPMARIATVDKDMARKLYDTAIGDMERYVARYPNDVRARLGYMDLLRSGGMATFGLPVEDLVRENLRIAEDLSPGRQQVNYSKITFMAGTGQFDEALELAKREVEGQPTIADGYYTLTRLYAYRKDHYKVADVLDRAILAGVRFSDPDQQGFVAEAYERIGRFYDALYWYDQMFRSTGNPRVAYKRDELARLTQLSVPGAVKDFFPFGRYASTTPSL